MIQASRRSTSTLLARTFSSGIKHLGVIGCGQMGTGIALVGGRQAGYQVTVLDQTEERLGKSKEFMDKWLSLEIKKNRISEDDKKKILTQFSFTTKFQGLSNCDHVVEVVNQNFELKRQILTNLDKVMNPEATISSNTSSISITKMAALLKNPSRFMGTHFMNPVPKMKTLEVIKAIQTSDATFNRIQELAKEMQKDIIISEDRPGFIINRCLVPYLNEAIFALYEGVGTREDIDSGIKGSLRHPMGPLELADFIGLDTLLAIQQVLYEEFCDSKYRPCPLLIKMVEAGYYGKKVGKGFYDYPKQ